MNVQFAHIRARTLSSGAAFAVSVSDLTEQVGVNVCHQELCGVRFLLRRSKAGCELRRNLSACDDSLGGVGLTNNQRALSLRNQLVGAGCVGPRAVRWCCVGFGVVGESPLRGAGALREEDARPGGRRESIHGGSGPVPYWASPREEPSPPTELTASLILTLCVGLHALGCGKDRAAARVGLNKSNHRHAVRPGNKHYIRRPGGDQANSHYGDAKHPGQGTAVRG